MTDGTNRRTLAKISYYPTPRELYEKTIANNWPYETIKKDRYILRDNALVAVLYCGALRISEAQRLIKNQFQFKPFRILAVKLSKAEKFSQATGEVITRKDLYRKEIRLPNPTKNSHRAAFSRCIMDYLEILKPKDRLFPIKNSRMFEIVNAKLGVPPHWLRAYAENHLYELWDCDLIAVANYVQVDAQTLSKYIHRVPEKYLKRE